MMNKMCPFQFIEIFDEHNKQINYQTCKKILCAVPVGIDCDYSWYQSNDVFFSMTRRKAISESYIFHIVLWVKVHEY